MSYFLEGHFNHSVSVTLLLDQTVSSFSEGHSNHVVGVTLKTSGSFSVILLGICGSFSLCHLLEKIVWISVILP